MADDKQPENLPVPASPKTRLGELVSARVSLQSISQGLSGYCRKRAGHFGNRTGTMASGPLAKLARLWRSKNTPRYLYRTDGTPIAGGTALNLLDTARKDNWDLTALNARNQFLPKADLKKLPLNEADFSDALCTGSDFSNANLRGAHFRKSWLGGCNFSKADLRGADFTGARLGRACLTPAWQLALAGAFTCSVIFTIPMIQGIFQELNDDNGELRRKPRFTDANLEGAKFSIDTDFKTLGLSQTQIEQIVLVDKQGREIKDIRIGPDGSLVFPGKPALALPSPDQPAEDAKPKVTP